MRRPCPTLAPVPRLGSLLLIAALLAACSPSSPFGDAPKPGSTRDPGVSAALTGCRAAAPAQGGRLEALCETGTGAMMSLDLPSCPADVAIAGARLSVDRLDGETCAIRMPDDRVVFARRD